MIGAAFKMVGFDLQRQLLQLKAEAEDFGRRATDEARRSAVNAGLAVGLAFAGLMFVVITVVAALMALYLAVEIEYGSFAGLGAVALAAAALAVVLFVIAMGRAKSAKPSMPQRVPQAEPLQRPLSASFAAGIAPISPDASLVDAVTHDLKQRTTVAAGDALEQAGEMLRKSPREAILTALAVAAVAGVVIGRRRSADH